jgi:hypothetical protein
VKERLTTFESVFGGGCFRNLLLGTCPQFILTKALAPKFQFKSNADAKFSRNKL